jgi:phosphoglycerol geranylgeranyltransferase
MKFDKFIRQLNSGKCLFAVLIDPDKFNEELIKQISGTKVNCFLVGGSFLKANNIAQTVRKIKKLSDLPVILFPGDETQLTKEAEGLLLLSLLSGRNPEYLIGKHIKAAPIISKLKIPHIPTAYLLIDGGNTSTTQKVTGTPSFDSNKTNEIIFTSMAGEQLGFKALYLEAGSGAQKTIPASLLKKIKQRVKIPVIVGGGIDSSKKAKALMDAGANMIVVGNALERNPELLNEINKAFIK